MSEKIGRNDPCHCGSGKKLKVCHGQSSAKSYQLWTIDGVLVLVLIWFFSSEQEPAITSNNLSSNSLIPQAPNKLIPPGGAPPGKVWSSEHGHWHDSPSIPTTASASSGLGEPKQQPPGDVPPGKVWSSEHGHWHDSPSIPAAASPSSGLKEPKLQPSGDTPPGKLWSSEHGHWHDSPSISKNTGPSLELKEPKIQPPGDVPPGKVWSQEHGHFHDE